MKKHFLMRWVVLFVAISLVSACSKFNSTDIGQGLVAGNTNDATQFNDTLIAVSTYTKLFYEQDTSKFVYYQYSSSGTQTSFLHAALGVFADNRFGTKTGGMYFSPMPLSMGSNSFTGTNIVIDSVKLKLKVTTYYGDTTAPISLKVYELADTIIPAYTNGFYKFSDKINYDATNILAQKTFNISDIHNESLNYQIEFKMPISLGTKLANGSADVWASYSAFRNFFKGLAVLPDMQTGSSLVNINCLDSGTQMVIYYKSISGGDTLSNKNVKMYIMGESGVANNVEWKNDGSDIKNYLNNTANKNTDKVFVQSFLNTKVCVDFSDIKKINANKMIFKAELIAHEIVESSLPINTTKIAPKYLFAFIDSGNNSFGYIPKDYALGTMYSSQIAGLGGYRIDTLLNDKNQNIAQYKFFITRYVQSILRDSTTYYPLIITAFNNYPYYDNMYVYNQVGNGAAILAGGAYADKKYKMYLHLVYKKY